MGLSLPPKIVLRECFMDRNINHEILDLSRWQISTRGWSLGVLGEAPGVSRTPPTCPGEAGWGGVSAILCPERIEKAVCLLSSKGML